MRLLASLSTILLLSSISSSVRGNKIEANCVTPGDALGTCVEVRYCVSIMTALINNDHLTNPNIAKYLRESQCGIRAGSHKVCCDIGDVDYGDDTGKQAEESTTSKVFSKPPSSSSSNELPKLSDRSTCGILGAYETPLKWVGELWFKTSDYSKSSLEMRCLGTLISRKHLVVPAHCVANLAPTVSLEFIEILGTEHLVSKIFIHASYNQPKFANDIAIIELDRDDNGAGINDAVCLPESDDEVKSSIAVVKRAGRSLKFGKSELIAVDDCRSLFRQHQQQQQQCFELSAAQFCANVQANDSSSNSPIIGALVIDSNQRRQYTFKGLTSTSIRTEQANDESRPYIFTDMAYHLNWIRAAVGADMIKAQRVVVEELTWDLKTCQLSNGNGKCVQLYQCSLYRDAPKPLSSQQEDFLDQIKCFTGFGTSQNTLNDDGICCPEKYIELNAVLNASTVDDIDVRIKRKRGIELLDTEKCGSVVTTRRIVGGTEAQMKEFPWIGLVKYKVGRLFKFTCGSSLISDQFMLTCAHCITNLPTGYEVVAVRLGDYDRRTDPDCVSSIDNNEQECNPPVQDIKIGSLIPHPDYNTPKYANDIGLIKLLNPPDLSRGGFIPICLPINADFRQTISDRYTVAGFGFTEKGRDSDVLLKVVLPKVSKETCQSLHGSMIQLSKGQECYGGESIKDSCKGDSGNPLMNYVNLNGRIKTVQMGIVTAGHSNCGKGAEGFPGIYTDIAFYLPWILDNMDE